MNQQAQNKRKFPYVAIILWVTVALVVVVLGHTLLDTIGIYGMTKAGTSISFRLSENHLDVYRFQIAQAQYYNQYLYIRYGMMSDPTGGMIVNGQMSDDEYVSLMMSQGYGQEEFDEQAYTAAEEYLTYCEAAKKEGLYDTYKAEVTPDVDAYIQNLKTTAKEHGYTFSGYLSDLMGHGVSEKDLREAMEYYYIAAKHAEKLLDGYAAEVTEEQKIAYRDSHKESFYSATYTYYKLVNADKMGEQIQNAKTVEDVKTIIVDYYMSERFDSNYTSKIEGKDLAGAPSKEQTREDVRTTVLALNGIGDYETVLQDKETDPYKKAAYEIVTEVNTAVTSECNKITSGASANFVEVPKLESGAVDTAKVAELKLTDLQVWLFGTDNRQPNETEVITTTNTSTGSDGKETTTKTTTWYLLEDPEVLDEERTKNIHYIELNDDAEDVENGKKAQAKADEFLKAMENVPVEERPAKFIELVKKFAPSASTELAENLSRDTLDSTSTELADWVYDSKRVKGDLSSIFILKDDEKDKEKITGCSIALFMGENEETWKINAEQAIASEKLTEWYKKAVVEFEVEMDYEPAETTAAETTAAKN